MLGRVALLSSLLLTLLVVAPVAPAAPVACVMPAPLAGGPTAPGPYWQVNALAMAAPMGFCGGIFVGAGGAAVCPPAPFIGAVPGAYCGPAVPLNGKVTCTWFRGTALMGTPVTMIVGFDQDGDGQITLAEPAFDGWAAEAAPWAMGADTYTNAGAFGGRLIAYPTTQFLMYEPLATWIDCA